MAEGLYVFTLNSVVCAAGWDTCGGAPQEGEHKIRSCARCSRAQAGMSGIISFAIVRA